MGIGASNTNKNKPYKDDATFCIICYENDIQCQGLVCGHAFCLDCILSISDYEDSPRCPLCRHCIEINYSVENVKGNAKENGSNWYTVARIIANFSAIIVSCFLFCYKILPHFLPMMQGCFQDWDLTTTNMYGYLSNFRLEYGRVKESWF